MNDDDFIICADGGYLHAKAEGIIPDVLIGDFDSMDFKGATGLSHPENNGCEIIQLAAEKDDTDTMVCLKYGIDRKFENFFILGGLGGRLDHTIANLQTISYAIDLGKNVWIIDGKNRVTLRNPGMLTIEKLSEYKLSLFSYGECCAGVCIQGVKYPLKDCLLTHSFPLGVSNEFIESKAEISHSSGKLCIVLSKD